MAAHSITGPEPCLKVGMRHCQSKASFCFLPPNIHEKNMHEKRFQNNLSEHRTCFGCSNEMVLLYKQATHCVLLFFCAGFVDFKDREVFKTLEMGLWFNSGVILSLHSSYLVKCIYSILNNCSVFILTTAPRATHIWKSGPCVTSNLLSLKLC